MSPGRRILVGLYTVGGVVAVFTILSLWTGVPDIWPDGYELTAFLAVTLLAFVIGLVAIVDYLIWPARRSKAFGVRLMSVAVVAVGFVTGYLIGSRVSVRFRSGGPMDEVIDVIGPNDPILSVALAIVMACLGAFLVWMGIRNSPTEPHS